MKTTRSLLGTVCAAAVLAGTGTPGHATPHSSVAASASASSSASDETARQVHASMTRDQRIGQLFMVATPADSLSPGLRSVVAHQHVGNVILMGRSTRGANHIRSVSAQVQALTESPQATLAVPAFVSADQEGGQVQVLQGPGFSRMPSALDQGRLATSTLTTRAHRWGTELSRSGVNTNLAPVLDVVPPAYTSTNVPIARYDRQYGPWTSVVTAKGGAVQTGMTRAGVATTVKHFPGLGRVRDNTDTTSGVRDTVTTRTSGVLTPFAAAVDSGTPFVMMSSAVYTRIDDRQPALFSRTVVTSVLRQQLGFDGVVMTDDVGNARQLAPWTPAQRATKFIDAGGDMVLTARTDTLPQMFEAIRAKAASSPAFAAKVDAASLRVLQAKGAAGLLESRGTVSGNFTSWTVKRLQAWLGKPQTGRWDAATIRSVQWRIGTSTTGRWDARSFRALQTYLGIAPDGTSRWDTRTTTQLQRYLNTQL